MTTPTKDKLSLDELIAIQKEAFTRGGANWEETMAKRKKVRALVEKFEKWRHPLISPVQGFVDDRIIAALRKTVPAYNRDLRAYREIHKVSPVPVYHFEEPEKWSVVDYDCNGFKLEDLSKSKPSERRGISIAEIELSTCGFCGDGVKPAPSEERKYFSYRRPNVYNVLGFGVLGDRVLVCGEQDCSVMALSDYARLAKICNGTSEMFDKAFLEFMRKSLGRDVLTETQANYIINEGLQRLFASCTENNPVAKK